MFLTDRPIHSFEEDTLGRSDFARSLALATLRHKQPCSLAIGLYGGWGFGKTSIINMALEYINSMSKDDEQKPIVVKFNPWNFSDQNQLIYQFFKHISYVFKHQDSIEVKDAGKNLEEMAKFFQPFAVSPILKTLAEFQTKTTPESFLQFAQSLNLFEQENLDTIRERVDKDLGDLQNKIIIVVDDIDRLNGTEIKQMFQLVKSLADFPNTIYILSFNKNVVLKTLEDELKGCSGSDYLEDIIQVPFVVPTIPEVKIRNILYSEIEELVKNDREGFVPEYWKILYNCSLKSLFKDIRNINRFMNVLKFDFELVRSEINIIEFMAITSLQVFEPYIYDEIKNNKELFCYGKILNKPATPATLEKITRNTFNEIIQKREKLSEEELKILLSWLFPKVGNLCGYNPSESELTKYKIDPSISDPGNFETYFKSAILDTKVSSKKISKLISNFKDPRNFREILLNMEDYEIDDFLTRLINPDQFSLLSKFISQISRDEIVGIITGLLSFGDELHNNHMIEINKINNIILYFVKSIDDLDERFEVLKQAVSESKDNIYISSLVVYNCVVGRVIINQEHVYELRELIKTKIETYEKFHRHENLALILANFKKLGYRSQVNYYIEKLKQNDENFIHFVSTFLSKCEILKGVMLRADAIRILLPLLEIDTKLREINNNINIEKLDDHKKYVIKRIFEVIKHARLSKPDKSSLQ